MTCQGVSQACALSGRSRQARAILYINRAACSCIHQAAIDGMVLIGTLVFWSYMLDFASFKFPIVERFTAAPRLCLMRDGKLLRKNMRREFITDEELRAKIRQEDVEEVPMLKLMYREADGEMSLIRQDGAKAGA